MGREPYFSINFSRQALQDFLRDTSFTLAALPAETEFAFLWALNEQARPMKKLGFELVKNHYTLKAQKARERYEKAVRMVGATAKRPFLIFRAETGYTIPIGDFKTSTGKRQGVRVQPVKGGKLSPVRFSARGTPIYKGFWFAGQHSAKRLVGLRDPKRTYMTKGRVRERVVETKTKGQRTYVWLERPQEVMGFRAVMGPDVVAFLKQPAPKQFLLEKTFQRFQERFVHHLEWRISRRGEKILGARKGKMIR